MVRRRIYSLSPSRWRIQLRAHLFPLSTRSYFFPNRRNLLICIIPPLSNSFHVFTTPKMKTSIVYIYVVDHDGGEPKAMIVYFIRTTILCLIMATASETNSASFKKPSLGVVSAKAENEYQVYADLPLPSGYSQAKINTMPLRSTYFTVFSEVSSDTEDSQGSNSRSADTLLAQGIGLV